MVEPEGNGVFKVIVPKHVIIGDWCIIAKDTGKHCRIVDVGNSKGQLKVANAKYDEVSKIEDAFSSQHNFLGISIAKTVLKAGHVSGDLYFYFSEFEEQKSGEDSSILTVIAVDVIAVNAVNKKVDKIRV